MHRGWPVLALMVAGCSERGRGDGNTVDLAAAASEAEADIDNYSKVGAGTESGDAAADVVRGTFAALADRRWADARAGWHDPADVTPLEALRQRHDRIVVQVGRPDVSAIGARRVTVPVAILGIGPSGEARYRARLGLRRGPSGSDWVVRSATITSADAALPATARATYDCSDGLVLSVDFDNRAATATVSAGRDRWRLVQQRAASGIHYAGAGADLRGKGRSADWTLAGRPPVACTAR